MEILRNWRRQHWVCSGFSSPDSLVLQAPTGSASSLELINPRSDCSQPLEGFGSPGIEK